MEYLYLTSEQNELLNKITADNNSNMILIASPYEDGFILNADCLTEPLFGYYMPLLVTLPKITIE